MIRKANVTLECGRVRIYSFIEFIYESKERQEKKPISHICEDEII